MTFFKTAFLISACIYTSSMAMELDKSREQTEQFVQNCLYEIKPKKHVSGIPCYLTGTQHVNGKVTDGIVNFVATNCSHVSFEIYYQDDFETVTAPYFSEILLETHKNKEAGITFPSPKATYFLDTLDLIKGQFRHIGYDQYGDKNIREACEEYCNSKMKILIESHAKQDALRERLRETQNQEFVAQDAALATYLENRSDYQKEIYSKLSNHDKEICDLMSNSFPHNNPSVDNPFDNFDNNAENQAQTQIYIEAKTKQKKYGEFIASLQTEMDPKDKINADALLALMFAEDKNEQNKEDPSDLISQSINPIDIITLALYSQSSQFINKVYQNLSHEEEGVEENLRNAVEAKNSGICFSGLESDLTRLRAMRKAITEHVNEMNAANPYELWETGINLLNSSENMSEETLESLTKDIEAIFDNNITEPKVLPYVLFDVFKKSLTTERETPWVEIMKSSMTMDSKNKSSLFAVGNNHVQNLLNRFSSQKYDINKIEIK